MIREPDAPSPCVSICRLDPATGFCEGCGRNIQEIASWTMLTRQERLALLERLKARRTAAAPPG